MLHHVPRQSQQDTSPSPSSADPTGSSQTSAPPSSTSEPASVPSSNVPPSSLPESSNPPDSSSVLPSSSPPDSSSIPPSSLPPSSSSQFSTPIPPPSAASITPTLTPPPPQSSFFTPTATVTFDSASFTTFVTTLSDGSVSTVTSLASPPQPRGTSSRIGLIAGTTTAGIVALLCILGVIFAYRRNKLRRFLDDLTSKRKEHKGLLEDEDFDDDDPLRGPGAMRVLWDADRDREMHTPTSYSGTFTRASQPSPSPSPSLYRACASESGSIFREEGVWPPPGRESQFVDPFVGHVKRMSNEVDLTRIVDEVMGSGAAATSSNAAAAARLPPTADHSSVSGSSPTGLSIATSASSDLTTAPPQFTLSPLSGAPPPSLPIAAAGTSPDNNRRSPNHSDPLRTASSTPAHTRANTGTTSTSASMYSDSGATARTDEVGLISLGSTPVPSPVAGVPSPLIQIPVPVPPPPPPVVPRQQQQNHQKHYELPSGAARSVTPGLTQLQLQNNNNHTNDGRDPSFVHRSPPFLPTTTTAAAATGTASTPRARDGIPSLDPIVPVSGTPFLSESIKDLMAVRAPLLSLSSSQAPPGGMTETLARQQQDGLGVGSGNATANASVGGNVKIPLSQPKKSSPLARASSGDAKIFLGK